jgi:hypothetical protein
MRISLSTTTLNLLVLLLCIVCKGNEFFGGNFRSSGPGAGARGGSPASADDSYYDTLGLSREANEIDIKKAYRKLVRGYALDGFLYAP